MRAMAKKKPNLADYVEAAERRAAPKARARVVGDSGTRTAWLWVLVVVVMLLAGGLAYLRMKRLI